MTFFFHFYLWRFGNCRGVVSWLQFYSRKCHWFMCGRASNHQKCSPAICLLSPLLLCICVCCVCNIKKLNFSRSSSIAFKYETRIHGVSICCFRWINQESSSAIYMMDGRKHFLQEMWRYASTYLTYDCIYTSYTRAILCKRAAFINIPGPRVLLFITLIALFDVHVTSWWQRYLYAVKCQIMPRQYCHS